MRPIFVVVGFPHGEFVVDRVGVGDVVFGDRLFNVVDIAFVGEFGAMDANDLETLAGVFLMPLDDVGQGALAINAAKCPDVDEGDAAFEVIHGEGAAVQPAIDPLKLWEHWPTGAGWGLGNRDGTGCRSTLGGLASDRRAQREGA